MSTVFPSLFHRFPQIIYLKIFRLQTIHLENCPIIPTWLTWITRHFLSYKLNLSLSELRSILSSLMRMGSIHLRCLRKCYSSSKAQPNTTSLHLFLLCNWSAWIYSPKTLLSSLRSVPMSIYLASPQGLY